MKSNHRKIGFQHELKAIEYLQENGYEILVHNFYCYYGEIDIIARSEEYLVFIEVKYRKNDKGGHPLCTVNEKKMKRICKTASFYCMSRKIEEETKMRFDVIGILGEKIFHIEDAFYYR